MLWTDSRASWCSADREISNLFSPFLSRCTQLVSFLHQLTCHCAPVRNQFAELRLQPVLLLLKHGPEPIPALLQAGLLLLLHSLFMVCWHTDKTVGENDLGCFSPASLSAQTENIQPALCLFITHWGWTINWNVSKFAIWPRAIPKLYELILNEASWWYRDAPDLKIIFSSCRESA